MAVKTDNFNRADSVGNLGTSAEGWSWSSADNLETGGAGGCSLLSNQATQGIASILVAVRAEVDLATDDNYAQADVVQVGTADGHGVCCRMSTGTGPSYYLAYIRSDSFFGLYKNTGGQNFVELASTTVSISSLPVRLKVQAVGTSIKAYWGSTELTATDSAITTGKRGGFRFGAGGGTTRIFDNFEMGDVAVGGPPNVSDNVTVSESVQASLFPPPLVSPLLTNLISYWKMDEASGDAIDVHGTNTLTDNNTVDTYSGKINTGRFFNSTNSEFFSIASNSTLQTGNIGFTFQVWVRLESATASRTIISKSTSLSSGGKEYSLFYSGSFVSWSFEVDDSTTGFTVLNSYEAATAGVWYCIHAWQDITSGEIGLSVNAGTPYTTPLTITPFAGSNPFFIGKHYVTGAGYLWGTVDEVGFWKRVLSADERTALYNGGAGLAYPLPLSGIPALLAVVAN